MAICLLHSFANPSHEELVERMAREAGFTLWCHFGYPCRHFNEIDLHDAALAIKGLLKPYESDPIVAEKETDMFRRGLLAGEPMFATPKKPNNDDL